MITAAVSERTAEIVEASALTGLVRIFEAEVGLCHLPRPSDPTIDAYLVAAAPRLGAGLRQVVPVARGLPASILPDLPGRQALVNDIAFLAALYGELLGCDHAALRLEVVGRAMCPRFHVDRTGIRLLCTWRGPGTEWLRENSADRSKLGAGAGGLDDAGSGLILDPGGIGRVAPYAIALLKGELWQGHAGHGVIHRSPAVPPESAPRVLLALDAVWD
ncbi:MAG: DUF1826 domain-containing protein [Betaproteobacteria bacterium]|nr:DUF1826 domain-containing protein [Betaproteobacteria bacterium]